MAAHIGFFMDTPARSKEQSGQQRPYLSKDISGNHNQASLDT